MSETKTKTARNQIFSYHSDLDTEVYGRDRGALIRFFF